LPVREINLKACTSVILKPSTSPLPLVFGVPQGSGLGPVEFIAYTETTTDFFSNHHILYHLFADDTQGYDRCYVTDVPALLSHLSACVKNLNPLYSSLRLQLTLATTEFICFGSRSNLAMVSPNIPFPYCVIFTHPLCLHCAQSWCDI